MVLTPGTNPQEIATLERVQSKMTQLLEHDPKDFSFDAMRAALAIRSQVEEIYAGSDQSAVRESAKTMLDQLAILEEKVSNLAMVADMQGDVIQMNLEVITALADQREELRENLSQARTEAEDSFDQGYRAAQDSYGVDFDDPYAYGDPDEEAEDLDETSTTELSEADKKARAFDRWVAWHDTLTPEEIEEYRNGLDDEERAWYDDWSGHA